MREIVFRCRCGAAVRSRVVDPTPRIERAVRRVLRVTLALRCGTCGLVAEYHTAEAAAASP